MVDYYDWFDAGPFEQVWTYTPAESAVVNARGVALNREVRSGARTRSTEYWLTRGILLAKPWEDLDARLCALAHATDEANNFGTAWVPGTCAPVTPVSLAGGPAAGTVFGGFRAGTEGSYFDGPLTADRYMVRVSAGTVEVGLLNVGGPDYVNDPFTRYYRSVPAAVLMQVPGWYAYVSSTAPAADQPQVEPTLIRVETRLEITTAEGDYGTVNAHRITGLPTVVPPGTAATGVVDMSVSGGAGSAGAPMVFPDFARGEGHQWHIVTSRIENQDDPGQGLPGQVREPHVANGRMTFRAWWTVRARIPKIPRVRAVAPPLRQVQRDDGLGRSPARARAVGSRQGSQRQRAYL